MSAKIIYAFYGLGKTTLASSHKNVLDFDKFYHLGDEEYEKIENGFYDFILTNDIANYMEADMFFLPKDLDKHKKLLKKIGKMQFFDEYPEILGFEYNFISTVCDPVKLVDHITYEQLL